MSKKDKKQNNSWKHKHIKNTHKNHCQLIKANTFHKQIAPSPSDKILQINSKAFETSENPTKHEDKTSTVNQNLQMYGSSEYHGILILHKLTIGK